MINAFFKNLRPVITVEANTGTPSISFELAKKLDIDNKEIEDRINQLDEVREKLIKAADAISLISDESKKKKVELDNMHVKFESLKKDKETAEKILQVDKDSFARLLIETNKKTEKRSIWIGIVIGFMTGTASSLLIYLADKFLVK